MAERPRHHKLLAKRFNVAMLRALAEKARLGNTDVLTVLLENAERAIDKRGLRAAVDRPIKTHCRS